MIGVLKPYTKYKDSGVPWLQNIPGHWELRRLGAVLRERGETNAEGRIVDVLSVTRYRGVIPYSEKGNIGNKKSEDIARYKIVRPNDIVVNCMNVIIGSVGLSKYTGCLSPVYYVLMRRNSNDDPAYLNAYFQTKPFQQSLVRIGNGILAHRMRIPMELLKCEPFPVPPPDEQGAIVRFLDWTSGRIDRVIRAKRKIVDLLNEQKQVVIHRAVTRGLDAAVSLKPSGIPWLGEIPKHWEVKPLGAITKYISYGFTNPMPATDDGPYMLTATDIDKGRIQYATARHTSENAFRELLTDKSRPRPGDLLITKDGTLGRVAIADETSICINQSVALLRLITPDVSREFIAEALQAEAYQQMMIFNAGGTTIKHIYITRLVKMKMALPPIREQQEIAAAVQATSSQYDALIGVTERQIAVLREYRTRLTADVVTGKLDVRDVEVPAIKELPEESVVEEAEELDEVEEEAEPLTEETYAD
jgi:type I restriction enzyme S subunit